MNKRMMSLLLAALLLLTALPFAAMAQEDEVLPEELPAEEVVEAQEPEEAEAPAAEGEEEAVLAEPISEEANGDLLDTPYIETQPEDAEVKNGKKAVFSLKAEDAKWYQWQVSRDEGSTWTDIAKATKKRLSVKATKDMDGYQYRCVVANAAGYEVSDEVTLTVLLTPPVVYAEPEDAEVKLGKNAVFAVKAFNAKKYQWQVSTDGSEWKNIAKATKAKLVVKGVTYSMDGYAYRCLVTNTDGTVESAEAALTVNIEGSLIGWDATVYNCISWVNVRKGPSTKYALLGVAKKDETYTIEDISGSWYKVDFDGEEGWIHTSHMKLSYEGHDATIVNCKTEVNVRKGPGTLFKIIGTAKKDATYTIKDFSGSWFEVDFDGQDGWIHKNYIKVD